MYYTKASVTPLSAVPSIAGSPSLDKEVMTLDEIEVVATPLIPTWFMIVVVAIVTGFCVFDNSNGKTSRKEKRY
ncbi:hypothetical protein D3C80_1675660 [compost metagenome]